MKNSPEHILKDMYTSVRRNKFDRTTSFPITTSLSMTHVVPFLVKPLTGNTTVSLDLTQYLLTESTPTPVFEGMRVDTRLYFCPLRHYVRGMYGDNIDENVDLEQLQLPKAELSSNAFRWADMSAIQGGLVLRGSLLNRLGVPPQIIIDGVARPLNTKHLVMGVDEPVASVHSNSTPSTLNYAVVAAYYDICWRYLSNKFEDKVPIGANNRYIIDANGSLLDSYDSTFLDTRWHSLSLFGRTINHLRGVLNAGEGEMPYIEQLMYDGFEMPTGNSLTFGSVNLWDGYYCANVAPDSFEGTVGALVSTFEDKISNCGLWPTRYDSHYQTMFFKPSDIDGLIEEEFEGGSVKSYRVAQANFSQRLRSILRGRTTRSWVNATYGTKLKFHDHPIFVGGDSFVVNFQNIVASAPGEQQTGDGVRSIRLGDSGGRGVGGTKKAFSEDGKKNLKEIRFTTQEPGFLIGLVSCVPAVSYGDVVENFHEYDTLADFPMPARSGKLFESLRAKNFLFTGTPFDNYEVGKQPYGFSYMTEYGRVNSLYGTRGRESYVFKRDFDVEGIATASGGATGFLNYLKSVYVEPNTFDNNFNDAGINGRQNFTLKTMCNMSVILPLEDQVTDYNAF